MKIGQMLDYLRAVVAERKSPQVWGAIMTTGSIALMAGVVAFMIGSPWTQNQAEAKIYDAALALLLVFGVFVFFILFLAPARIFTRQRQEISELRRKLDRLEGRTTAWDALWNIHAEGAYWAGCTEVGDVWMRGFTAWRTKAYNVVEDYCTRAEVAQFRNDESVAAKRIGRRRLDSYPSAQEGLRIWIKNFKVIAERFRS